MDINSVRIGIIGVGNMGSAIARALLEHKDHAPARVILCESSLERLEPFRSYPAVHIAYDLRDALLEADVVIVAVKPQEIKSLLNAIPEVSSSKLWLSIAAGVSIDSYRTLLRASDLKIVRAMPNTPAMVGQGMTGWTASASVTAEEKELIRAILSCFGCEIEVPSESEIDMVTAISGSGPAYFFHLVELLAKSGTELGLSMEESTMLATETFIGAAALLRSTGKTAEELRLQVTSRGGTTHAAITSFTEQHLGEIISQGVKACYLRAGQLGKEAS
ncbi:pyrroline-5-carboxylate reductase [Candidatus Wirthbacteria bacterium CG2_30_54_11]|uniref:Pyrroline-5-carboxylate reductase n=1 Tax=Candidatus Wirthbacteria bacterium CG2_30_54_11 TaxID=1817892 RepID=A0A1J5ICU0_9BACT|nr:MAG: pyrroline-5-carboxylate reductase [Candidatus Wirthbacteria bacterium CG2_30_54_11]